MGVYIDREQAIKCLDSNVLITRQSEAEAVREYFEMVIKRLENLPTTDFVRCGECKYMRKYALRSDEPTGIWCHRWSVPRLVTDDDFCSYGERRADERIHL